MIWNASKISGRPALVALMAGNAAHDAEITNSATLLAEINGRLQTVFPSDTISAPREVIVTRWKRDPFTRGTYSYVGPRTRAGDYDVMAEPVGNLHFAGEATCGTHPGHCARSVPLWVTSRRRSDGDPGWPDQHSDPTGWACACEARDANAICHASCSSTTTAKQRYHHRKSTYSSSGFAS